MPTFQHQSVIPTTVERMVAFHSDPDAFARLTPPPIVMQLHRDDRSSLTEGEIEFTLWFGPIPARWTARHEPGTIPTSFADRQINGPLKSWRHEHLFEAVPGGVRLTDRIQYEHREGGAWPLFTRLFFAPANLRILFFYRHLRTRLGTRGAIAPAPQAQVRRD
ncbi:MAG: SRPBCC family protein [Anaerolineae bacterium]